MEPRHHLRCLGQPALFAPNGEPIRFRTKKHLALLVYLAVERRRAHRRDRLAEFLWPRAPLAEARHSLATGLSILRPRLGIETLQTTRDHVSLASDRLTMDLDRLIVGDVLGPDTTNPLEVAPFLDGFEVPDAPEFALWKDGQQARLLPAIKDALIVLIERCRRTGEARQIEQYADRMLLLDELSEEAIRAKMEARAFAGDRLTALKIFENWKQKLAQELAAVPSDLVEGMAVRLRRRGWERMTLVDVPTVPTDQWKGRPFVGRTQEYRGLYEAWEQTQRGVSTHVIVLGDSGVGKSTLVDRITTAAGLEGAAVSRVQCYDLERDIAYAAVGSLIRGLLDRPGVSGTPPESLAEIARTVPEVRRRFPTIPPSDDSVGETARIRLTESFYDLLHAISEEHPVVLVVDDLHLADEASLAVLHLAMRRAKGEPVLLIMVARHGEMASSPQASCLRDSTRTLGLKEFEILPLSDSESIELLDALVAARGKQPSVNARRALLKAAAGFPMVLELLFQDWETNGGQSLALTLDAITVELATANSPPQIYREVLERLVRTMEPGTQTVLNIAAILGHRLNDVSLYSIADLSVGRTMTGMAELVSRRVLRDGSEGLEFVNELLRAAAYVGIPSPLRRAMHSSIADRLISSDIGEERAIGLEIAWHCMRAGRTAEAAFHLIRGARATIRTGAPQIAERALSSALPGLAGEDLTRASLLLAEVLQEEGRMVDSLDVLSSIEDQVADHRRERLAALRALAHRNLGAAKGEFANEELKRLMEIVRSSTDVPTRALAGRAIAYLLLDRRDRRMTVELLALLDMIPAAELDADAIGHLALARALLLYQNGDSHASFAQASNGIEELSRRGAANLVTVQLQAGLGSIMSSEGQYEAAIANYEQALGMANRLGNDRQIASIAGNIALCCGRLGRYPDQLEWAGKIGGPHGPDFTGFVEAQCAYSQAFAHAMCGRCELALSAIDALDRRLIGPIPAWIVQGWSLWKADLMLICRHRTEANVAAQAALRDHSFILRTPAFAGPYARWLSLSADTAEEKSQATERLMQMGDRLDDFDALDQVEILCALSLHQNHGPLANTRVRIAEKLGRLPHAIQAQLARMEQLPFGVSC
jgi:DNA-binding SARP family transcriptional activator